MVKLEVGKFYITRMVSKCPIEIVYELTEGTEEYSHGARFQDSQGGLYDANGAVMVAPPGLAVQFIQNNHNAIFREVGLHQFASGFIRVHNVSPECLNNPDRYVPRGHSDFHANVGSLYFTVAGMPVYIDSAVYSGIDIFQLRSGNNVYTPQGRYLNVASAMHCPAHQTERFSVFDLAFQRRHHEPPHSTFVSELLNAKVTEE